MTYFLLEYNRLSERAEVTAYADAADALKVLSAREGAKAPEVEVVLLMADSVEQLKRTHSRYFLSAQQMFLSAQEMMDNLKGSLALPA